MIFCMNAGRERAVLAKHALAIVLGALIVTSTLASGLTGSFYTSAGRAVPATTVFGRSYTLLVIVKPWDGSTLDQLKTLERRHRTFQGRIRPVVLFLTESRATTNQFVKSHRYSFRWYIDVDGEILKLVNPSCLPFVCLVDEQGSIRWQTSYLRDDELRSLAQNPGRALRRFELRTKRGIPVRPPTVDHGPWGPPEPDDHVLSGDDT